MIDYNKNCKDLKFLINNWQGSGFSKKLLDFLDYKIIKTRKNKFGKNMNTWQTQNKFVVILPNILRKKLFKLFIQAKNGIVLDNKYYNALVEALKICNSYVNDNIIVDNFDLVFHENNIKESIKNDLIEILKKSISILKNKGFKHLIYGKIFVEKTGHSAALYVHDNDTVRLNYKLLNNNVIGSIIHELGHRHWYKFMTWQKRLEYKNGIETNSLIIGESEKKSIYRFFANLLMNLGSGRKFKAPGDNWAEQTKKFLYRNLYKDDKLALQYWLKYKNYKSIDEVLDIVYNNNWIDSENNINPKFREFILQGNDIVIKTKNKRNMKILAPTKYGETNEKESFAVTFEHYFLNKPIDKKLEEIFLNAIK